MRRETLRKPFSRLSRCFGPLIVYQFETFRWQKLIQMAQNLFLNIYFQFLPLSFLISSAIVFVFFPMKLGAQSSIFWGCLFLSPRRQTHTREYNETRKELKIFQFIFFRKADRNKRIVDLFSMPFRIIAFKCVRAMMRKCVC